MVIVNLIGGLGNQMFQYAAARRIAYVNNTELKLDISSFTAYKLHSYSLNNFSILESIASKKDIAIYKNLKGIYKLINKFKIKCLPYYKCSYLREKNYHFDSNILKVPGNVYLEGYWQSEKYFNDIKEIIHQEFCVKYNLEARNKELAKVINDCESVSIHIRRGDYVKNKTTNQVHGVCSLDYYYKAIDIILEKCKNPYFFVFSDDHEWVKKNIKLKKKIIYIEHNSAEKNYEDLRLMSLCKNNIIANSSFSWWGAWLNTNPNKIIMAPKKWFNNNLNTTDLIPKNWIII